MAEQLIPITPDNLEATNVSKGKNVILSTGEKLERITFEKLAVEVGLESKDFEFSNIDLSTEAPTKSGIYIPTEAGTYPNAGGLVYDPTEGITYFIRANGVWTKDVTPVNFTPIGVVEEGNTQAVSGGEVFNKINDFNPNNIFLSNLAGISQYQNINLSDNKLIFNYNPLFITGNGKFFKIIPLSNSVFEIPLTKNTFLCIKKQDLKNITVSEFTSPVYLQSYIIYNITSDINKLNDYIILLNVGDSFNIYNDYPIGKFYHDAKIINNGFDSLFTDKAPIVNLSIEVVGESINASFSRNPRVLLENGKAMYLFPESNTVFNLPTLNPYDILYVDLSKFTANTWEGTKYLNAIDLKKVNFLNPVNLENKVVLAINQAGKLMNYGAIGHKYYNDLTNKIPSIESDVTSIKNSIDIGVSSVFPKNINYQLKLKDKCPNFYKAMQLKNKDVVVCYTGTSLTQGNLYTTIRPNASERPPLMHGYDLASLGFDKLISMWQGQQYRRYDHSDLTYSASSWSVINTLSIWDDSGSNKNGLTKTTTSANASVSTQIASNAWQFNFIYRTDSEGGDCTINITQGNSKVEVFNGVSWVEANGHVFSTLESNPTSTKGNTCYQKRLKMRCKNKSNGGINSLGTVKNITISKGNNTNRFNVVGFEWSPREYMLTVINGARGSHQWGVNNNLNLEKFQDLDIWEFNPDLIMCEATVINWGGSYDLSSDPNYFTNCAKNAYFNEFGLNPNSIYEKSDNWTKCEVVFYGDTLSSLYPNAWNGNEPAFGLVTSSATNGGVVDISTLGMVKNVFENYYNVDNYMLSKSNYIYIPVTNIFNNVAYRFYGSYKKGFEASGFNGASLSSDGTHLNNNGALLWSTIVNKVFEF